MLATIIGSGIVFLDSTVVTLALPNIAHNLHASFSDLQWVVDGYLLTLSALILLGGSLGDILGRKKTYMAGLVGFGIFSLLCGLAPSSAWLIIFRMLQGVFGALLVPGGLAIINTNFPKEERGKAIGQWSAWSAVTVAIGPLVGGYLIDTASWRWIFFINVPLILVCLGLAQAGVVESKDEDPRRIDFPGAALAALSLAGITYGLIQGPVDRWQAGSLIPLVAGFILAFVFVWYEARDKDPMLPLGLFKSRNFSGSNIMTFAMYGALGGFFFVLLVYLQSKMGYSSIKAGVSLLPVTLLLLLLSSRTGALSIKIGPKYFMSAGPIIAGLAILSLVDLKPGDSYVFFLLPRVILFGIGLSLMVAPLTTTVMTSVKESSSGIASAVNNAVSRVAGLIVVALLGILGTAHFYKFGILLCGILAVSAGILSWFAIVNPSSLKLSKSAKPAVAK